MRAKKHLGQNFLHSQSALFRIVSAGEVADGETVVEIGPGRGALTAKLLKAGAYVIAIEKDADLIPVLASTFARELATKKLRLLHGDVLETDISKLVGTHPYKVIANIPYYITSAIIRKVCESKKLPSKIVLLVQKEVAERIVARDGKESILSLAVKWYGTPRLGGIISRGSFNPVPSVDSAVLVIDSIKPISKKISENKAFFDLIHTGFAHKRKMLVGNLEQRANRNDIKEAFKKIGIPEHSRAEDLQLNQWVKLSTTLKN